MKSMCMINHLGAKLKASIIYLIDSIWLLKVIYLIDVFL